MAKPHTQSEHLDRSRPRSHTIRTSGSYRGHFPSSIENSGNRGKNVRNIALGAGALVAAVVAVNSVVGAMNSANNKRKERPEVEFIKDLRLGAAEATNAKVIISPEAMERETPQLYGGSGEPGNNEAVRVKKGHYIVVDRPYLYVDPDNGEHWYGFYTSEKSLGSNPSDSKIEHRLNWVSSSLMGQVDSNNQPYLTKVNYSADVTQPHNYGEPIVNVSMSSENGWGVDSQNHRVATSQVVSSQAANHLLSLASK